mgnify:CR=1 FL=1
MLAIRCNALRFDCTLLGSAGYGLATPAPIGPQARPRGNTRAVCRGDRCRVGKHCPPIGAVRVGNKLPTLLGCGQASALRGNTRAACRADFCRVGKHCPPIDAGSRGQQVAHPTWLDSSLATQTTGGFCRCTKPRLANLAAPAFAQRR